MSAPLSGTPLLITAPDPLVGRALDGRYRVDRLLARGTSGRVYEGVQLGWDKPVAIKVLDTTTSAFDLQAARERFDREARVLARLRHPNTVRVVDAGTWEGLDCLIMELVLGQTLKALVGARRFSPTEAVAIARQICCSLHEAHEHGLVHRDLKPGNVLLASDDEAGLQVKVVDFGLAIGLEGVEDVTLVDKIVGSPLYMAPEQIRGQPIDGRADLYALGGILFHLLAGRRAFDQDTSTAVLMAHLLTPLPALHAVARPDETGVPAVFPPCLETTVARCMDKVPQSRFGTAAAVDDALEFCEQVLRGELPFDTPLPDALLPGAPGCDSAAPYEEDSLDLNRVEPDPPRSSGPRPVVATLGVLALLAAGIGLGLLLG